MNMVKIVYHFRQTHTHQLTLHKRYIKNIKKTMQTLIFHKHCIKKLKTHVDIYSKHRLNIYSQQSV